MIKLFRGSYTPLFTSLEAFRVTGSQTSGQSLFWGEGKYKFGGSCPGPRGKPTNLRAFICILIFIIYYYYYIILYYIILYYTILYYVVVVVVVVVVVIVIVVVVNQL